MSAIRFDTYYRYDALARFLTGWAASHPHLVRLEPAGRSHEGREIYVVRVTNYRTGPDTEKPALWVDGNIHAAELAGSMACLHLIDRLITAYGKDPEITRCLDTRAFYVCPRVNPDGAEWALADVPRLIRSSTRPYPYDEDPVGGLAREDVDGDGRILSMRIVDPNGPWKTSPQDPRVLVRRDPVETGGKYYRVLPEGRIDGYDGVTLRLQARKEGLDLNRNFPAAWRLEHEQPGAGPYPTSEPEVAAVAGFIARHPNVTGAVTFHTYSGVILRPHSHLSDDQMVPEDLWTYRKIGEAGTRMTGYPAVSTFHDFRYHPKEVITGDFDAWMFEHRGVFAWTVELWSPQRQAGIGDYQYIEWYREHPPEDDARLMQWNDTALGGRGFVDWYPFDHPQLGPVELGGWDSLYTWTNPPPKLLEKEIAPFSRWLVWHALISPRLEVLEATARRIGEDAWRVRLVVHNTGWLPSYVTRLAKQKKLVRGVICEIELPDGVRLESGTAREDVGQLEGRAHKPAAANTWAGASADETDDRAKAEWVVRAPPGTTLRLRASHERAGTARAEIALT
ncbi:MAG TPA: M14 family metallopeptidase [Burkholderiales bacterium]|jgi:murein tripeptide amidase MpaA|nr:M14 family metallopeptidase [Burkholderiales bacterium]